jgi:hypothetical protein
LGQNKVAYRKSAYWKCLKSSWVVGGVGWRVASYPLLSQTPTPVEVELGCDKHVLKVGAHFVVESMENKKSNVIQIT